MQHNPRLPKKWDSELAYFCGLITGDGSLPIAKSKRPNGCYQKRYMISFYSGSMDFMKEIYEPLFTKLFNVDSRTSVHKTHKGKNVYISRIESKLLYNHLLELGFTNGRKARIAKVPEIPSSCHNDFLAGLLDTDGGKKGSGFGLSTASKHLAVFTERIFKKLKLSYHSCPWIYKGHKYHQIYVHKKSMKDILKYIPLKNKDKINFINASVAQW